jgi:CheY-like chemotaxis protein
MLVSLLDPLGFAVSTAENGQIALQRMSEQCPDLVILDLIMPVMDGLETIREIRKRPAMSGTRIIGSSATVMDSTRKEAFAAACDAFLTKPIQIDLLLEQIREQLGIAWNRAASGVSISVSTTVVDSSVNSLETPPVDELKSVHELALLGDLRKVQAWAAQLEEKNPKYRLFAGKLRELAGTYRTKAILALLNEHMEEK